jgi:hypothetical protein
MKGLEARLRRAELVANPQKGCHVVFVPDELAAMEGNAFERWQAAATRDAPQAATIIFVQFSGAGGPSCTNHLALPDRLWPSGSRDEGEDAHEPPVQ